MVLNSGVLFYTKHVSTTPTTPSQPCSPVTDTLVSPTQHHQHIVKLIVV